MFSQDYANPYVQMDSLEESPNALLMVLEQSPNDDGILATVATLKEQSFFSQYIFCLYAENASNVFLFTALELIRAHAPYVVHARTVQWEP